LHALLLFLISLLERRFETWFDVRRKSFVQSVDVGVKKVVRLLLETAPDVILKMMTQQFLLCSF
jgi:hypothetical protein